MNRIVDRIEAGFEEMANPAKAVQMAAYMKNQYSFYGVNAPNPQDLFRMLWIDHKAEMIEEWRELVQLLWKKDQREYQMMGLVLLRRVTKKMNEDDLRLLIHLIKDKSWWDTVDAIASTQVGYVLSKNKAFQYEMARKWIQCDNMWIRRTALIHQLKYKEEVDIELLFELIDVVADEKEFFIKKAAGWALRDAARRYPNEIIEYVNNRAHLSGLTKREALKHLSK